MDQTPKTFFCWQKFDKVPIFWGDFLLLNHIKVLIGGSFRSATWWSKSGRKSTANRCSKCPLPIIHSYLLLKNSINTFMGKFDEVTKHYFCVVEFPKGDFFPKIWCSRLSVVDFPKQISRFSVVELPKKIF